MLLLPFWSSGELYARQAATLYHYLDRESMRAGLDRSCVTDLG